ncbi:PH domain-containing protein [Nocardiopsis sp. FR26]|uniref:PH domain-containing protein n=1 Tax=Nocardiopsis sp. FR26 TaxID=2605987 RepID=UPI0013596383|nr:PH domain-containing protein [Nocardiopsis sp. FR26]
MREDLERATGVGGFALLKKALAAAETELGADETVNAAGAVNLDGKNGVAVATNRRLLFVSAGMFGRTSTSSVALPVAGVDRGRGKITLHTAGGDRTFKVISGARELEQAVLNPGGGPVGTWRDKAVGAPGGKLAQAAQDAFGELDRMLADGEITEAEHAERKARMEKVLRK